ncbi:right-handed parallel beta-helix repeat-containing protein, partial [Candidatus Micrarchaeota archaeon]|nr:right-handed parallel beta-helix repeat-containing protein [Candidatus Micrarchaeota archaeon]
MLGFRNNLLCLVFAILLVSFSFAIDVSSCWQINESGSYDLTQNISGAMPVSGIYFTYNACIIISAPNVTFNCAGYNVTNNASTDAAGILVNGTNTGHENVTIENCPGITGFERSIYLHNTTRDVIRNVTVYDSDYGIVLHESTHNHLYNISLYNVSHRGLHLGGSSQYNSDYNNISNVSVYDIGYGAIAYAVSVGGDYNNLTNISISNTSTYGFYIDGGASHNQLRGSTIRNTRGGIYIRGSNNTVADTITHSSEEYGAQISGSEVNFTDNTIYNNSIYGVRVYSSANYFTMFNNTVYNNSYNGEIRIENSNYSKILDSDILHNGYTAGIRTEYADYYLFANNTLYNNTLEGIYSYYSDNGTIINNTAYGNGASGIYTRYSDYINTTNNTLYSNGGSGFRAISADHGIISNNTAYGNTEYGFQIGYYAYNSSVTNNIAHNNTLNGFHLDASEDSNLTDNVAADNGGSGFNLQYASNCTLRDSLTYGNNGSGVYYYGMGAGTVSNITIRDNLRYGLYVYADDANVANNTIHDNVGGVCLDGGISSYITNNTIYNDPVYGIYLNQSYSNIFSDNTIYNATYGISAFASFYATYANTTVYNTSYGIYLLYGNSSRILNNEVYDSEYGIYLDAFNYLGIVTVASDYNNVTGNSIYNNSVYGVYSNITTEVIFSNNTLYSNGYAFYNLGSNYTMETCLFLNSSGDFSAYANLSATDIANSSEEYSINWSAAPSSVPTDKTSFEDKFVNITTHAGNVSIDSISWLWDESEASGHTEADFSLWSYNSSGAWTLLNDTPDTTSNVLRQYDMNPASIYGIFEGTDSENVSTTDPGGSDSDFECFTSSDCDDCYVCSDHECILPAGTCASPADCTG